MTHYKTHYSFIVNAQSVFAGKNLGDQKDRLLFPELSNIWKLLQYSHLQNACKVKVLSLFFFIEGPEWMQFPNEWCITLIYSFSSLQNHREYFCISGFPPSPPLMEIVDLFKEECKACMRDHSLWVFTVMVMRSLGLDVKTNEIQFRWMRLAEEIKPSHHEFKAFSHKVRHPS